MDQQFKDLVDHWLSDEVIDAYIKCLLEDNVKYFAYMRLPSGLLKKLHKSILKFRRNITFSIWMQS